MRNFAITCVALFAFAGISSAQDVDVKKIEFEVQPTPSFDAGGVKSKNVPSPRSWLEIEVEFEAKQKTREGIYPQLKFRYHVAIKGRDGVYYLTGDVDHVNVVAEKELYSVCYVSPAALGTITGDFEKFQAGDVAAVGVEVYDSGVLTGMASEGQSGKWWESSSLKRSGAAISKKENTPFALLWMDRYADIATGGR